MDDTHTAGYRIPRLKDGRLVWQQYQEVGTNQHCFRHLPSTKGVVEKEVHLYLEKIKDYFKKGGGGGGSPR